ncbi:hypothetical protein XENTR_v10010086 [Xenopus tropicalis]|uniref:LOC100145043 protein n=1 Tax=Xenopus tropicalis TaxID=8364 RepID=B0BMI1_XENTR|nr:telomerase RNA component interacting RNase [Xenopus tropicalis]AAI58438.1 LOC100145043 protein [Xenopus tropicalis]KAE8620055.1 hypothetical protein XENTR_v10010086 [Xenopus tropicalis]|eukprot:NP_001120057.1 uncharacterized protein C19orf43 homolog [Xenopus tropicalis]
MAEAQREVTEGDSEAEEEGEEAAEAPAQRETKKGIPAAGRDKAAPERRDSVSPHRDTAPQPPSPGSKRLSPLPLTAAYRGSSPTPFPRPSPANYREGAPLCSSTAFPSYSGAPAAPPAAQPAPSLSSGVNLFANDGSFMELFKKQMEAKAGESSGAASSAGEEPKNVEKSAEAEKRKPISIVGKRRGGAKLALKTGIVTKKPKNEEEEVVSNKGGAWAQYMAEVKKYKAHQCGDDDKTRPLVK